MFPPKAYSPRKGGKPRTPKKTLASVAPKEMYSGEETDEMKTVHVTGGASQETDQYVPSENERPKNRSRVVKTNPSTAGATKRGQRLVSEEEQSVNQTKDVRVRVSETPENVQVLSSEAGSVLKDVTSVTAKSTVKQSQWFVPDMELPRRRRTAGTTGAKSRKNTKMGKMEQDPSTSHNALSQAPSALGEPFSASTTQLLGRGHRRPKEVQLALSSMISPPSPPFSPPSASVDASLVASESQVEGNVGTTQRGEAGEQPDTKSRRKRGRQPKSTSIQAAALASKEGEVEEDGMTTQVHADLTEGETTSKTKRNHGWPSKSAAMQTAAVASSESELERESVPAQGHVDFTQGETTTKTKSKRGRHPKSAATQAAAVVSSESELEGESVVASDGTEMTLQPNKKRGLSSKPAPTQAASAASSESEREQESKTTEGQTTSTVDKVVDLNPKRKRGRQLKSANVRSVALASSESEFDEFLETLRPSQKLTNKGGIHRRKRTDRKGNLWIEPASPSTMPSKLEQIVEELKSEKTRRVGRMSPRQKTQPSASSVSKLEGEQSSESPGEVSGQSHKESKAAEPSSSRSHQEMDVEGAQMIICEDTTNDEPSLVSEVVYDESTPSTFETGIEEETAVQKDEPKVAKQRKRKQQNQNKPAESVSSEAQAEEDTEAIKTVPKKSKRGRGQSKKSMASQLPKSASSESEVGEHVEMTQQNSELEKKTAPKQGRTQSLRSSSISARLPISTTSESEMEEVTEGQQKKRSPRKMTSGTSEDQVASESENGMLRPKKKKRSKAECQAATINNEDEVGGESEGPPVESGVAAQYVFSDYDAGDVPLHNAHSATGEDSNVGSKDAEVNHSLEGAGKVGGEKEGGLSGAASVDVSTLPRLNKRKRGKGSKLVLGPKSKKRKKTPVTQVPDEVESEKPDEPANSEVYSMSTSGEGDNLEGMEITQSAGGRRYRRMRVEPSKRHTPGVRRGSRTRIAPVRHWENEQVEYDTRRKSGKYVHVVVQQRFT